MRSSPRERYRTMPCKQGKRECGSSKSWKLFSIIQNYSLVSLNIAQLLAGGRATKQVMWMCEVEALQDMAGRLPRWFEHYVYSLYSNSTLLVERIVSPLLATSFPISYSLFENNFMKIQLYSFWDICKFESKRHVKDKHVNMGIYFDKLCFWIQSGATRVRKRM